MIIEMTLKKKLLPKPVNSCLNHDSAPLLNKQKHLALLPLEMILKILSFLSYDDPIIFPQYGLGRVHRGIIVEKIGKLDCRFIQEHPLYIPHMNKTLELLKIIKNDCENKIKEINKSNELRNWLSQNSRYSCFFKYNCDLITPGIFCLTLLCILVFLFIKKLTISSDDTVNYYGCLDEDWRLQCETKNLSTALCAEPCNEYHLIKDTNRVIRGCIGHEQEQFVPLKCYFNVPWVDLPLFFATALILVINCICMNLSLCVSKCFLNELKSELNKTTSIHDHIDNIIKNTPMP